MHLPILFSSSVLFVWWWSIMFGVIRGIMKKYNHNNIRTFKFITNQTTCQYYVSSKHHGKLISAQFSVAIPPEDVRKPYWFSDVFRGYSNGTLGWKRLVIISFSKRYFDKNEIFCLAFWKFSSHKNMANVSHYNSIDFLSYTHPR